METAILNSKSKTDLKLLLDIAKKIGVSTKLLNKSDIEDIGLVNAIKQGRTGQFIDSKSFIKKITQITIRDL